MNPHLSFRLASPAERRTDGSAGAARAMHGDMLGALPELRRYALSLTRHRQNAEDLVQDSIVRMLAAADRFQPGTNIRAWAFTIMRNLFVSACRSPRSRLLCLDDVDCSFARIAPAQDSALELSDLQDQFARLPPAAQRLLTLASEGERYEVLARADGCSVGAIKSRVHRTRAALARQLSVAYGEHAAAGAAQRIAALADQPGASQERAVRAIGRSVVMPAHRPARPG